MVTIAGVDADAVAGDEAARDLIGRARQLRQDARVPPDVMAGQVGVPIPMLTAWETRTLDLGRLNRRYELAVARWVALLAALDRDQAASGPRSLSAVLLRGQRADNRHEQAVLQLQPGGQLTERQQRRVCFVFRVFHLAVDPPVRTHPGHPQLM